MEAFLAFVAKWWLTFLLTAAGVCVTALWNKFKATYKLGKDIQDQQVFNDFKKDIQKTLTDFKTDVVNTISDKETNMLNQISAKENDMLKQIADKEKRFEEVIEKDEKLINGELDKMVEKHKQHQEILETSRKISQDYRNLYSKGFLYILKRSYFEDCERLLDPDHVITYEEFASISEDHSLYKEFGGNGRGDENFELIKSKYHEQTL